MSNPPSTSECPTLDLRSCEREPIHLLSAIEPNGCLLVVGVEPTLAFLQVSSNTLSMLGIPPALILDMRLGDLFSQDQVDRLLLGTSQEGRRSYLSGVKTLKNETVFDALAHRFHGLLMIELEPSSIPAPSVSQPDTYASITSAMDELQGALPLVDLCQHMANRVRLLTGFDRVMVYRFLKDDSGSVVAEDRRPDLVSYLGLRYPASDIPAQARRLYLINTLRLKGSVSAPSAVLIPSLNPLTGAPLDMTYCVLRAMSPVHVEYLRNMGVGASLSISIVKDGRLWGLIACHHCEARLVPHPIRITCEVLARVFSTHIAAAEQRDERQRATGLYGLIGRIEAKLRTDRDVVSMFSEMANDVTTALGAQGGAFRIGGKMLLFGTTPNHAQVEALFTWLHSNQQEHVFVTERLSGSYPGASEFDNLASGLLSLRVAFGAPDFVIWFRPAIVQVIDWAGNPAKPVEEFEGGQRISPRRSFEKWKQTYGDSSEPWTEADREFATALRPLIAETLYLNLSEETDRLNVELARSNVELESFAYTASHDLLEPVRTIRAYSQLLARSGLDLTSEMRALITTIEDRSGRMASLINSLLSYSQLGGTLHRESQLVNLEDIFSLVLTNLEEAIRESSAIVTHDILPVVISDPDHMSQLLQNLISNAIKYRRPDSTPHIHLSSRVEKNSFLISVHDNGQGFDPQHSEDIFTVFKRLHGMEVPGNGVGLATCKRIVELYKGRIWAESCGKGDGAIFSFTMLRSPTGNLARGSAD